MTDARTMPALTVWQPWATLIAEGIKPFEFRGWCAPRAYWGRRIAIHAGARPIRRQEMQDLLLRLREDSARGQALDVERAIQLVESALCSPGHFPRGAVIATASLGVPKSPAEIKADLGNDSDRVEHFRWGWPMLEIERLSEPIQATGSQGFWTWKMPDHD